MIYKVKKYLPAHVDRRKLLEERYLQSRAVGLSLDEYKEQDFWPLLEKQLDKQKRYLDAGCGIGGWILFLQEEGYSIEGFDEAPRVLKAMTEYNRDIQVKQGELTAVPYANDSFDGVLAIGCLDHAENTLDKALTELHRVVKPGGILFLEMPLLNGLRNIVYVPLKRLEAAWRRMFGQAEVFAGYFVDQAGITELLTKHGFTVETMQPHDLPAPKGHYGLYVDWPFLRGQNAYQLNGLGRLVRQVANAISPWAVSTGIVVVAKKK